MDKNVLFISSRPLGRCENITAVYEAWPGNKIFNLMKNRSSSLLSDSQANYDLVITDELVIESKAPVIMIGHGINGGKLYLLQKESNPESEKETLRRCSQYTTYAVATSHQTVDMVAEQCGIEQSHVLPFGMPRTDAYKNKRWGDGGTHYAETTAYLYAPTFRTLYDKEMPDVDWQKLDDMLTDDEIFIVKPHMCFKGHNFFHKYKHIVSASQNEPSTPYLIDCDVVVTDYSSIMLDSMLLRRPVVLFAKDKDQYLESWGGMSLPYPEGYSERFCDTEEELINLCRTAAKYGPTLTEATCITLLADCCDGKSTERLVSFMEWLLDEQE